MERAVVCCIAKDEEIYIDEWIQHNLRLKFDHIYIYDNSDSHTLREWPLKYLGQVTLIHLPGAVKQMTAYNHFKEVFGKDCTWCAYIDVDEFIMMRKHNDIHELLREHCARGGLSLNWYLFGSSGETEYRDEPITRRFQRRAATLNEHTKMIVRMEDLVTVDCCHYGKLVDQDLQHDTNGRIIHGPFNHEGTDDVACIHHYFLKSKEEFRKKALRGRADTGQQRDFDADFGRHDCNEVHDSRAYDFNHSSI